MVKLESFQPDRVSRRRAPKATDSRLYRLLRWLNEGGRQTLIRGMLWRWRASAEDRTRLKQRVRCLEGELREARR